MKYSQVGERLRELREKKLHISQEEFAKRLGISGSGYQNYELGKRIPHPHTLTKIAEMCDTTVDWILYGKTREQSVQNELRFFTAKIKNTLEEISKLGAIPKATVSEDEIAIIKLLRLLSQKDSITILRQVMEAIEGDPNIPKGDKYYDRYVIIVRDIIQSKRFFSQGIDFDGLIWGYEALEKRKGAVEEKRSYPRISVIVPVEFQIIDQPESRSGVVMNGNQMGCLIQASHDMPVGTRIHLKLTLPGMRAEDSFRASAEIMWKDKERSDDTETYHYGVRFLEVLDEGHAKLDALINQSRARQAK